MGRTAHGGYRWASGLRPIAVVLFMSALLLGSPCAQALEVALLLSENKSSEQQFAEAFRAALKPGLHRVVAAGTVREGFKPEAISSADVVLASGTLAVETALRDFDRPVLAVLVGLREVKRLQDSYPDRRLGAVVLDQPPARHMRLVRSILPAESRLGVLIGPDSRFLETEVVRAASNEGLVVEFGEVTDPKALIGTLQALLESAGALLPLPDGVVSSPSAARAILLTSYRYKRPIFAFSSAYVTAGALAAVFSTPEHIGNDVADLFADSAARAGGVGALVSEVRFPERFDVAVNRTVARALAIAVPEDEVLRERVAAAEGAR